jgi:uncharacterized protein YdhG (YjbR/CyaY superfamily)
MDTKSPPRRPVSAKNVDDYVSAAPSAARPNLRRLRAAIREAAPDAVEGMSYGMPHYSFREESGFASRLCYFGLLKGGKKIAFYTRPQFLEGSGEEVAPYLSTKSALRFPVDKPLPVPMIKKIVRYGVRKHTARST